jgi:putative transcriptional regulator
MFKYKIDVLQELKKKGFTTTALRREGILSENTIQRLRSKTMIGINALDIICEILDKQPSSVIHFEHDPEVQKTIEEARKNSKEYKRNLKPKQ